MTASERPSDALGSPAMSSLPSVVLALLTGLFLYLSWTMIAPFLSAFTWSFALALVCSTLRQWLIKRFSHLITAVVLFVAVVLVIALPVSVLMRSLFQESQRVQSLVQTSVEPGQLRAALAGNRWLAALWGWADQQFDIRDFTQRAAAILAGWIGPVVAKSARVLSQAGVAAFALFFFLRDQESILTGLERFLPLAPAEITHLFDRIASTVRTAIYGRLFIGSVQGALGGIVFALVGLPAAVFWGTVMSLLSILPFFGAFLVWVPAAVFLLAWGHWIRALVVLLWGLAVIHPVDNVLYPVLVGARLGLHPLVLFVAFVGGLIVFGPAGLILGPCVIAATTGLTEIWQMRVRTSANAAYGDSFVTH